MYCASIPEKIPCADPRILLPSGSVSEQDGDLGVSPNGAGVHHLGLIPLDVPFGKALQRLLECYAGFKPRQRGAEAEMRSVAE